MTIRNTYAAEAWDKVYEAFSQINFTSYDYDTIKESLLQYLKIYHAEHFNDFIESSELIALLEVFAYTAEQMAYRVDMMSHENFISTAQRKQSILRLAKLVSYRAARNIPARGLVKISSVRTSEQIFDSLGNNLQNTTVFWNDPNNTNWKEQFFLVINRSLTSRFGRPQKSFQVGDVAMSLYTLNNNVDSFNNGVLAFTSSGSSTSISMEVVPIDIDENGPFERAPDINAQFNIVYASDGRGDGSDFTGFLMLVKQGTLFKTEISILQPTENRRIELNNINVNDTDIWVYRVDDNGNIIENWSRVENLNEDNLYFNGESTRKKYEIDTLENDRIAIQFGDNGFSDAPVGDFQIWTRTSANEILNIPKNQIVDQSMSFGYITSTNIQQSMTLTFSLTSGIQNNSPSETIEHVRQSAPATYYAQNRMVNGQDYNTFMLKDQTILRLRSINRTFAGQPKYIEWNDASGKYENIKLFGDDLVMFEDIGVKSIETTSSAKVLIDGFIEPLLIDRGVVNTLNHISQTTAGGYGIISEPRKMFIEDNRGIYKKSDSSNVTPYGSVVTGVAAGSLNEKSAIQSALDRHWYGSPTSFAIINNTSHGVIPDPLVDPTNDGKLYEQSLPRTIDGINTYPPGDSGSGLQTVPSYEFFGLRFHRFLKAMGGGAITLLDSDGLAAPATGLIVPLGGYLEQYPKRTEVFTIELLSDSTTFSVISNIRGRLADYSLIAAASLPQYIQQNPTAPFNFSIATAGDDFQPGDSFIIDLAQDSITPGTWVAKIREFDGEKKINLNGWWELISSAELAAPEGVGSPAILSTGPNFAQRLQFDTSNNTAHSWVFLIARKEDGGNVVGWEVFHRDLKLVAESANTKFWYNQNAQILDSETKKPVLDKIRVLRSNLDADGVPLLTNHIYDVVGAVTDDDGVINFNRLEIKPTDNSVITVAGEIASDNILQFSEFARDAFEFFLIDNTDPSNPVLDHVLSCDEYTVDFGYGVGPYDIGAYDTPTVTVGSLIFQFGSGDLIAGGTTSAYRLGRRRKVPAPAYINPVTFISSCNVNTGLDFMWQHFSPVTNLIDPSVTNIHDTFIMTRGYYNNVLDYVRGFSSIEPTPPTPLELRTSYGYLLENKMLSDTVVMHSGKIKLLFGQLAQPELRAKFRVVKADNASFSNERIKSEIITVINTYFDIDNWDFGDRFFATELITLIHQRLSTQISSVVLVPTFSINSFGSLFTIDSGFDEILQSAATVSDIEIVDALTSTALRQR